MKTVILYMNEERRMVNLAKRLGADIIAISKQSTKVATDLSEYDHVIVQYGYYHKKISPNYLRFLDVNKDGLRNIDVVLTDRYFYDSDESIYELSLKYTKEAIRQQETYFRRNFELKALSFKEKDREMAEFLAQDLSAEFTDDVHEAFTGGSLVLMSTDAPTLGGSFERELGAGIAVAGLVPAVITEMYTGSAPLFIVNFVLGMILGLLIIMTVEVLLTKGGFILSKYLRCRNGTVRGLPNRKKWGYAMILMMIVILFTISVLIVTGK